MMSKHTRLSSQVIAGQAKVKKINIKQSLTSNQQASLAKGQKRLLDSGAKSMSSQSLGAQKVNNQKVSQANDDYMIRSRAAETDHALHKNQNRKQRQAGGKKSQVLDSKTIKNSIESKLELVKETTDTPSEQYVDQNNVKNLNIVRPKLKSNLNSVSIVHQKKQRNLSIQARPQTVQASPNKNRWVSRSSKSSKGKRDGSKVTTSSNQKIGPYMQAINESEGKTTDVTAQVAKFIESSPDYRAKEIPMRRNRRSSGQVMSSLNDITRQSSKNSKTRNGSSDSNHLLPKKFHYKKEILKQEVDKYNKALREHEKMKQEGLGSRKKKQNFVYRYRNQPTNSKATSQIMASTGDFSTQLNGQITEAHLKGLQTQINKYSIQFTNPSLLQPQTDIIPKQVSKKLRNRRNSHTHMLPASQIERVDQLRGKGQKKNIEQHFDKQIFQIQDKMVIKAHKEAKSRRQRAITALSHKHSPVRKSNILAQSNINSQVNLQQNANSIQQENQVQKYKNSRSLKELEKAIAENPSTFLSSEPVMDPLDTPVNLNSSMEWQLRRRHLLPNQPKVKHNRIEKLRKQVQNVAIMSQDIDDQQLEDVIQALCKEKTRRKELQNTGDEDHANIQLAFDIQEHPDSQIFQDEFGFDKQKSSDKDSYALGSHISNNSFVQDSINKREESKDKNIINGPQVNSEASYLNSVHVKDDESKNSWPFQSQTNNKQNNKSEKDSESEQDQLEQKVIVIQEPPESSGNLQSQNGNNQKNQITPQQIKEELNYFSEDTKAKNVDDLSSAIDSGLNHHKTFKKLKEDYQDETVQNKPKYSQFKGMGIIKENDENQTEAQKEFSLKKKENTYEGIQQNQNSDKESSQIKRLSVGQNLALVTPDARLTSQPSSSNLSNSSKVKLKHISKNIKIKPNNLSKPETLLLDYIQEYQNQEFNQLEEFSFSDPRYYSTKEMKNELRQSNYYKKFDTFSFKNHQQVRDRTKKKSSCNSFSMREMFNRFNENFYSFDNRNATPSDQISIESCSKKSETVDLIPELPEGVRLLQAPLFPILNMQDLDKERCLKEKFEIKQLSKYEYVNCKLPGQSIDGEIEYHVTKLLYEQFSNFDDIWEQKCESDMFRLGLPKSKEMEEFKEKLPKYQLRESKNQFDMGSYIKLQSYNDIVLRNICPQITFIQVRDPVPIVNLQQMLLFDVQTVTGQNGIFGQFNWDKLKDNLNNFENQVYDNQELSDHLEEYLCELIFEFEELLEVFRTPPNLHYLGIHSYVKQNLQMEMYNHLGRVMPIQFQYKINLCKKDIYDHCFSGFFEESYHKCLMGMKFEQEPKILKKTKLAESLTYKSSTGYNFYETMAYWYLKNAAGDIQISQTLFRFTIHKVSIILYNTSDDLIMNMQVAKLMNIYETKKMQNVCKHSKKYYIFKDEEKDKIRDIKKGKDRPKSGDPNKLDQNNYHFIINHHLFHESFVKNRVQYNSDDEHDQDRRFKNLAQFKRKNALNVINQEYVDLQLQMKVEQKMEYLKDSCCLMYNRLINFCDVDDQDCNDFMKQHAYKSKLFRYKELPGVLFEVIVPCKEDKTQRKIDITELRNLKFIERDNPAGRNQLRRSVFLENIVVQGGNANSSSGTKLKSVSPMIEMQKLKQKLYNSSLGKRSSVNWSALANVQGGIRDYGTDILNQTIKGMKQKNEVSEQTLHQQIKKKWQKMLPEELKEQQSDFETDDSMIGVNWNDLNNSSDGNLSLDDQDDEESKQKNKRKDKLKHIRNVKKNATLEFYLAKEKGSIKKKQFYEITTVNNQPHVVQNKKKFAKMIQKKLQMDNAINEIEQGALTDNAKQFKQLGKELDFVRTVRSNAQNHFNNTEQYEQSKQGSIMEMHLSKLEGRIIKMMSVLRSNFQYQVSQNMMDNIKNKLQSDLQRIQSETVNPNTTDGFIHNLINSEASSDERLVSHQTPLVVDDDDDL